MFWTATVEPLKSTKWIQPVPLRSGMTSIYNINIHDSMYIETPCLTCMQKYTRNTQSAQYYASRRKSSLHAVQSEYETAISNRPQADD